MDADIRLQAAAWNECVSWFAVSEHDISDELIEMATDANPFDVAITRPADWKPPPDDPANQQVLEEAWQRCVEWFAIQGPLRGTQRVSGSIISNAEEENPYDDYHQSLQPPLEQAPESWSPEQ